MPVFNEEKSIGVLIEKLLKLNFSETTFNKEIIVVNDGSNDKSFEIIKKFVKFSRNVLCGGKLLFQSAQRAK